MAQTFARAGAAALAAPSGPESSSSENAPSTKPSWCSSSSGSHCSAGAGPLRRKRTGRGRARGGDVSGVMGGGQERMRALRGGRRVLARGMSREPQQGVDLVLEPRLLGRHLETSRALQV